MSPMKRSADPSSLEVRFIGDGDVLNHIVEKHEGRYSKYILVVRLLSG